MQNLSHTQNLRYQKLKSYLGLIESACQQLEKNIDDIATFYLSASVSSTILAAIQLSEDLRIEMHLSDNFSREITTIRNIEDTVNLCNNGILERLNSYQAAIALCSVFEAWVNSLNEKLEVTKEKSITIISWRRKNKPKVINNQTLCLVKSIHDHFEIDTQLCKDEILCWIYNFFVIRNIVVHEGGILRKKERDKLVPQSQWQKQPLNQYIKIYSNYLDDMVYFFKMNVHSFIYEVRRKCTLS